MAEVNPAPATAVQLRLRKVLVSDELDDSCLDILRSSGIEVTRKTNINQLWQTTCSKPPPQEAHGLELQTEPPTLSLGTGVQFHTRLQPADSLQSVVSRCNIVVLSC